MGRGLPGIEGRIGALLVASALWIGCAGDGGRIPVSTAFDPVVSFPAEATFVWDREHISLPDDPALSGLGIGQIVEEEAEAAFGARGYRHSTVPEADYLLSYHLRVDTFIAADRSSSTAGLSVLLVDRNGQIGRASCRERV